MTCRLCHRPLEDADRLLGQVLCRRAACRGRNEAARIAAERDAMTDAALARLQALPAPRSAREAVWLLPFNATLVATTDAQRDALRQALLPKAVQALQQVRSNSGCAKAPADVPDDMPPDSPAAGGALCTHCGGRCCTAGREDDAFLHDGALQRWLAAHPQAAPQAAVEDYIAALPASHVEGSCLYQGARGCALPRDRRGDTCNRFQCVPYRRLVSEAHAVPPQGLLVLRARGGLLESAVLVTPDGVVEPLPGPTSST